MTRRNLSPAQAGERIDRAELIDRSSAPRFDDDPELAEIARRDELAQLDEILRDEVAR